MSDDELRAACERVRRWPEATARERMDMYAVSCESGLMTLYYGDMMQLAYAYLAEHPADSEQPITATAERDALAKRVAELEAALTDIREWKMPPTPDGKPYGWHWGSNGERDHIRDVAAAALRVELAGK